MPGEARLTGSDPSTARLINLVRVACELRPDDDLLRVLLMHTLRMTGPCNPGLEPPHDAVRDLAETVVEDGGTIDILAILELAKNNVLTPVTRPKEAAELNASISPGSAQSVAARGLKGDAEARAAKRDKPAPE